MIKKEIVAQIKYDLEHTSKHINDIAYEYGASKATINNINIGKSHKEDRLYPIRQLSNYYFTDNEIAFIRKLAQDGYSAKQIHIIITKGSYSTISNIISHKTRSEEHNYIYDKFLEERRNIFNFIATPHHELVNKYTDTVTFDDAVYIKLLGRFMANILDTIEIFLPLIESNMIGFKNQIRNKEDLEKYLEWGGSVFSTIWWIKGIFNNKINRIAEKPIHYDNFPISRFREVDKDINLLIIKEMIEFDTKENYKKSEN